MSASRAGLMAPLVASDTYARQRIVGYRVVLIGRGDLLCGRSTSTDMTVLAWLELIDQGVWTIARDGHWTTHWDKIRDSVIEMGIV
ncbi:hypothetical protein BH20ACT18_BH20ACT18_03740 [soil metagenome]